MPRARYKTTEEDIEIASAEYNKQAKRLTKRELYASMAMQGMIVNAGRNGFSLDTPLEIAKQSVKIADSLIEELKK